MKFKTAGVCASYIDFEIADGKIQNISFTGGCSGNLKGISALAIGQNAADVAAKLRGIQCGFKKSSCPDQLATAIESALQENSAT